MMRIIDPDNRDLLVVKVVISISYPVRKPFSNGAYFPKIPVGLTRSRSMKMT
jgi:hypothetical protein